MLGHVTPPINIKRLLKQGAVISLRRTMSLREWRDFARRHPEVRIGARARARARRIIAQWKSRKPFNTGSYFYNRLLEVDCTEQELEFALAAPSHSRLSRMMRDKHPDPVVRPLNDWAEDALVRFTSGKFGFLALVKPWFGAALNDFHDDFMEMSKCAGGEILKDHKKLLDRAAATLASRLFEIIQGVCVLEQNVALLKRKLHGLTGDLRAKSFYLLLSKRKVRSEVLTEYPVILPLVINAIHEWRTTTCEFLSRLMHDYRQLCDTFNWTQFEGHLEGWEESQGDRHCGGRAVIIVILSNNRKLVYKPRSLGVEVGFSQLLGWLNGILPEDPLRAAKVVSQEAYGWAEFIESSPHETDEQSRAFYRRQGKFLAIFYALHATDMHMENVIASGADPIYVDVETLFHPQGNVLVGDAINPTWPMSVNMMLQLPFGVPMYGQRIEEVGGISATSARQPKSRIMQLVDTPDAPRLQEMLVEANYVKHLPRRGKVVLNPTDYLRELVVGFEQAARTIVTHKAFLLGASGLDAFFRDAIVRVLLRPTVLYYNLAMNSLHPNLMRHELFRCASFERLYRTLPDTERLNVLLDCERDELSCLNIPLFWRRFEQDVIHDSKGRQLPCRLPSARSVVRCQLLGIDECEVIRQSSLIKRLFGERYPIAESGHNFNTPTPREMALEITKKIHAAVARRRDDVYWLCSMSMRERELTWSAGVLDVYSGQLGVALYLALAAKIFSRPQFAKTSVDVLNTVSRWSAHGLQNMESLGVFTGALGYTYTFANVGILLDRRDIFDAAWRHLEKLDFNRYRDDLDIIGGAAGAILFLANLSSHSSLPSYGVDLISERVDFCATRLVQSTNLVSGRPTWQMALKSIDDIGFAHGSAGIAAALCAAGRLLDRPDLFELASSAIERESLEWTIKYGRAEKPDGNSDKIPPLSWCRGLSGLIQGRMQCIANIPPNHVRRNSIMADCKNLIEVTSNLSYVDNGSLCHGRLGNQMILDKIISKRELGLAEEIRQFAKFQISQKSAGDLLCGDGIYSNALTELFSPGVLTGGAGIAWGMLHTCDDVPNILSLELAK